MPRVEMGLVRHAHLGLLVLEDRFKMFTWHAHNDAAIHGHKAPIAVLCKAVVACFFREPLDGLGCQTDVQHRVHHPRH